LIDLKIHELIEGEIQTIAFGGEGVLRYQGFVIFVPFTALEDRIICRIEEVKKSFAKASLVKIIKPSSYRTNPLCPYFGTCGGCQIQHLNPAGQLKYKLDAVKNALLRIGHLPEQEITIVSANSKWAYRRHITVHLKPSHGFFQAGYITYDNHSLIVIKTCPIFNRKEDPVLEQLQSIVGKLRNPFKKKGRVIILKNHRDQYILSFYFESGFQIDQIFFENILQQFPLFAGIILTDHQQKNYVLGDPFSHIQVEGLNFKITPQTFIQNHPEQSTNINRKICEIANKNNKQKILDLYCGFGMVSLLVAKHHIVIGVEYNRESIDFAKNNAKINQIEIQFLQADVEKALPQLIKQNKFDLIIVNPPRAGLRKQVIKTLLQAKAREIIYVSCMPPTLARDLKDLCHETYKIKDCIAYDMFPQTAHVETLVHLITNP